MKSKKNKILILNTLTLFLCVVIIAFFCWTPKSKVDVDKVLETYKVVFDTAGGTYIDALEIEEGGNAVKPEDPYREGYQFIGWMLGDELYDFSKGLSGDITLRAAWQELIAGVMYFTVEFDTGGGTTIANQVIEEGQSVTRPEDPVRDGYTFKGWTYHGREFDFSSQIDSNMTIYAEWEANAPVEEPNTGNERPSEPSTPTTPTTPAPKTYTVRFDLNGGSGSIPNQTIESGKRASSPANPTRTGYRFNGWRLGSANGSTFNFNTPITSNITLYANWTILTYTVRFIAEDGTTVLSTQTVNHGSRATAPNVSPKAFYTFSGFYNTRNATGGTISTSLNITGATDFYARYTLGTFTVSCPVNLNSDGVSTNTCNIALAGGNAHIPSGVCIKNSKGACTSVGYQLQEKIFTNNFGNTTEICESSSSSNCVTATVRK